MTSHKTLTDSDSPGPVIFPQDHSQGLDDSLVNGLQELLCPQVQGSTPNERCWFGSCAIDKWLYVHAGYNGRKGTQTFLQDLFVLDLDTFHWKEVVCFGEMPSARYAHSLTAVNKKLYMFGGATGKVYYKDLFVFDIENSWWIRPKTGGIQPIPRCAHASVAIGTDIYYFGGDNGSGKYLQDLFVLDTIKMEFRHIKTKGLSALPRGWHTMTAVGSKLYIFGGCNEKGPNSFANMSVFNLENSTWETSSQGYNKQISPRYSHSAVAVGPHIAIIGGKSETDQRLFIHWYHTLSDSWWRPILKGRQFPNRYAHCSVVHKSKLLIFGGFDGAVAFNDVIQLDFDPERGQKPTMSQLHLDMKKMLETAAFADIAFLVEGKRIVCHKNILCARCPYFNTMFLGPIASKSKESQQTEITINDLSADVFNIFLSYVYYEQFEITDINQALDVLALSNLYQYDQLKKDMSHYIQRYLTLENCCYIYSHAYHNEAADLSKISLTFISQNWAAVKVSAAYNELEPELAEKIQQFLTKKTDDTKPNEE